MKVDFAPFATFAVKTSFFYRKVRKGRKENVQFDHVYSIYRIRCPKELLLPQRSEISILPIEIVSKLLSN